MTLYRYVRWIYAPIFVSFVFFLEHVVWKFEKILIVMYSSYNLNSTKNINII